LTKRVVDYNPYTGITTTVDYCHASDTTIIGTEQDVSSLLDFNKKLQNDDDYTKKGIKDGWWHYATYPPIIINKWLAEFGVNVFNKDHQKKVLELTNRPEYRYLKTTTKMHRG
jgi:hypothetical protein